jgi:hypothetical protein
MASWDRVLTFYNQTSGRNWLLMRCLRTTTRSYIWNAWSDGRMKYAAENMAGLSWKAMLAAADANPDIKARCDFYLHRVAEEFYDMQGDRYERRNLIADPARQGEIDAARAELLGELRRIGDPLAEAFARREDAAFVVAEKQKLAAEYAGARSPKGKSKGTPTPKAAAKSGELIVFELPATLTAGQPAQVKIRHQLPAEMGEQTLTVTLKSGNQRLDRQTVTAKGQGITTVTFTIPSTQAGKPVNFAAFIGTDFNQTPQRIQSPPLQVTNP